jgi:hypothetical protein
LVVGLQPDKALAYETDIEETTGRGGLWRRKTKRKECSGMGCRASSHERKRRRDVPIGNTAIRPMHPPTACVEEGW